MCKQGSSGCVQIGLRRAAWSSPAELAWQSSEPRPWGGKVDAWSPDTFPAAFGSQVAEEACIAPVRGQQALPPRPHRLWAFLALFLVLRRACVRPDPIQEELAPQTTLEVGSDRGFLQAGSLYQNAYMTLWNCNDVPISVTLRVLEGDRFELLVKHLNSKGGGSEGWFAVRGVFRFEQLPGAPSGQLRLVPVQDAEDGFVYDASLMDAPTAFACRCLKSIGGLLGALELAVDTAKDAVLVTPRASAVRMLWSEAVVLHLTSEADAWTPESPREAPSPAEGAPTGPMVVA